MSLRTKVLTIIVVVVGLYSLAEYAVQRRVILPSFMRLEREAAETDTRRCVRAIEREIQQLGTTAGDYGAWDETEQFVADANKKYIEDNISASSLKGISVNLLYICNPQGKVMTAKVLDLNTQEEVDLPDLPRDRFSVSHPLLQIKNPEDTVEGIMITSKGSMLVAARPVLNNKREGLPRGVVIMGRFLSSDLVAKLREQAQVQFEVLSNSLVVAEQGESLADAGKIPVSIDDSLSGVLSVTALLPDLTGRSLLPIKAVIPRDVTAKSYNAILFATSSTIVAGMVVLATLLLSLQKIVLGPLANLTKHVVRIGQTDDLNSRLGMRGNGEIGILAAEFDCMVERLSSARKKLIEQSYESGVAEMASGTLHNVRNALTPVLVELDMLRQELSRAPIDQLEQARKQLGEGSVSEERRQDLTKFIELAGGRVAGMAREANVKLSEVAGRAKQIEQFLSDQENASRADRPMERVMVRDLIQEAAALLPVELRQRLSIQRGPGVEQIGSLKTHRISLLQVFHNLLTNAAESISVGGKVSGEILVDLSLENEQGRPMVHLRVSDDGAGIAPENLSRIFERGFSTKGKASRGLGLHWCANAVAGLGGRMYAESDGVGRGASLHLLLPQVA